MNGAYAFVDLLPGTYRVEEGAVPATLVEDGMSMVVTDGLDFAGTINGVTVGTPGNDLITDIGLKEGDNSVMNNFTEICKPQPATATLSGTVFCDPNDNGILEAGEHRFAGVNIFLVDEATRTIVGTTTTDENGFFQFVNEPPGNYRIRRGPVPGTFTENGVLRRPVNCATMPATLAERPGVRPSWMQSWDCGPFPTLSSTPGTIRSTIGSACRAPRQISVQ